jgi:hypothetical protein
MAQQGNFFFVGRGFVLEQFALGTARYNIAFGFVGLAVLLAFGGALGGILSRETSPQSGQGVALANFDSVG